jgi:cell division septation protein DedD
MPTYINPNQHAVNVTVSDPRVSMTVWPAAWSPTRLPHDARQEVILDEALARELVRMGMLKLKPEPPVQTDMGALDDDHPMRAKEAAQDAQALGEPEVLEPADLVPAATPTPEEVAAISQGDTEEIVRPKTVAKAKPKAKIKATPKPKPPTKRRFYVPEE